MDASERGDLVANAVEGPGGCFTRKEAAVIAALMDYLEIEKIGTGTALALLALVRALHDKLGAA